MCVCVCVRLQVCVCVCVCVRDTFVIKMDFPLGSSITPISISLWSNVVVKSILSIQEKEKAFFLELFATNFGFHLRNTYLRNPFSSGWMSLKVSF